MRYISKLQDIKSELQDINSELQDINSELWDKRSQFLLMMFPTQVSLGFKFVYHYLPWLNGQTNSWITIVVIAWGKKASLKSAALWALSIEICILFGVLEASMHFQTSQRYDNAVSSVQISGGPWTCRSCCFCFFQFFYSSPLADTHAPLTGGGCKDFLHPPFIQTFPFLISVQTKIILEQLPYCKPIKQCITCWATPHYFLVMPNRHHSLSVWC